MVFYRTFVRNNRNNNHLNKTKEMSKKFIYGIAVVKFGNDTIGYIEKGSFDWGGTKPESTDIEAEQVLQRAVA